MACCVCVAATMAASRSSSNSSGSVGKELRLCFYGCGLIAEHHVVAVQRCREAGEVELQPPCGKTTRMHDCARSNVLFPIASSCGRLTHAMATAHHARHACSHSPCTRPRTCAAASGVATLTIALFTWPCTNLLHHVFLCAIASLLRVVPVTVPQSSETDNSSWRASQPVAIAWMIRTIVLLLSS
jgi:hypothetical protein